MNRNDPTNERTLNVLGTLLLDRRQGPNFANAIDHVFGLRPDQLEELLSQAERQRVHRRSLEILKEHAPTQGGWQAELLNKRLVAEQRRTDNVLTFLIEILNAFDRTSGLVMSMKTLDHWPDTGSDIDLLAAGEDEDICQVIELELKAVRQPQSWGDRLACKFNFQVPGLPELVEIHIGCLGQTGEHGKLASGVLSRRVEQQYGVHMVPVPTPEDRIIIATLQRMYRHYYIRLTDIVNIYQSLLARRVNFAALQSIAEAASIWPGVATLLTIIAQRGARYSGTTIGLPGSVLKAARFNSRRTYVDGTFVRVPVVPEAANLFLRQLAGNGRKHDFRAVARLSLLPVLATAAFVAYRLTGNDKGVW